MIEISWVDLVSKLWPIFSVIAVAIFSVYGWAIRAEMRSRRHEKLLSEEALLKFNSDYTTLRNAVDQHGRELKELWTKWERHKVD